METSRPVVVHYHLFKNAGSSIDRLLQQSFPGRWLSCDGDNPAHRVIPDTLREFIIAHPGVDAISSHQIFLPAPAIAGVKIIPIIMLRHPIERVGSVYAFEQRQSPVTPGAKYANAHSMREYVRWRLDGDRHGVINNYHTRMLQLDAVGRPLPLNEDSIDAAFERLRELPFFGLVERFDTTLKLVEKNLQQHFPDFVAQALHENNSPARAATLQERVAAIEEEIGSVLFAELQERNHLDIALYGRCKEYFDEHWNEFTGVDE